MTTLLAERLTTAAAKAGKPLFEITVESVKAGERWRGDKVILVDGTPWAWGSYRSCGPRGSKWQILQIVSMLESVPEKTAFIRDVNAEGKPTGAPIFMSRSWGDARPVEVRWREFVAGLIERKVIQKPETVRAAEERKQEAARRKAAERIQREAAAWREQAGIALAPIRQRLSTTEETYVIARIIEAMKWAQSRSNPDS